MFSAISVAIMPADLFGVNIFNRVLCERVAFNYEHRLSALNLSLQNFRSFKRFEILFGFILKIQTTLKRSFVAQFS